MSDGLPTRQSAREREKARWLSCRRLPGLVAAVALLALGAPAGAQVWEVANPDTAVTGTADAWASCTCGAFGPPPPPPTDPRRAPGGGQVPPLAVPAAYIPGSPLGDFAWTAFQYAQVGEPPCWCRSYADMLVQVDVDGPFARIRCGGVANANHDCRYDELEQCACPSFYFTGAYSTTTMELLLLIADAPPGVDEVQVNYRWNSVTANARRSEDSPPYPPAVPPPPGFPPWAPWNFPRPAPDPWPWFLPPPLPGGIYAPGPTGPDQSWATGRGGGVDGTSLFGAEMDLFDVRGYRNRGGIGSFTTTPGTLVAITYSDGLLVLIRGPARGYDNHQRCLEYDAESVASGFDITLSVAPVGGGGLPLPEECPDPELFHAVRIGSDTELSDPAVNGNEARDPGDGYMVTGIVPPLGGVDGELDDFVLFAFTLDPPPDPPDVFPPATAAPACSYLPLPDVQTLYFELDGLDQIDFSLAALMASWPQEPSGALTYPIERTAVPGICCVHPAWNLGISYADKTAGAYVACDIPTVTTSPLGNTYGSTEDRDEIVGLFVVPALVGAGFPSLAAGEYPLADEETLGLGPNPPPTLPGLPVPQVEDDDVGALDASAGVGSCPVQLFSASHEATWLDPFSLLPYDPGCVYEFVPGPGAPVLVIDESVHLGVPEDVDLDALEMVWLLDAEYGESLAVLFSVDDDDPATPVDESGTSLDPALNPDTIYYSFLTGSYGVFVDGLRDNVDAITAYERPILPESALCPTCPGDTDGSGAVDGLDMEGFVDCVIASSPAAECPCGDLNIDGVVDPGDISLFVSALLYGPTPPCP